MVIRLMAKQSKKIKKNINTPKEEDLTLEPEVERREQKPWERILLIAVICITLFLLSSGWDVFDNLSRGMYGMLLVSLLLMYAQRTIDATKVELISKINKAAFVSIGCSIVLFGMVVFQKYM